MAAGDRGDVQVLDAVDGLAVLLRVDDGQPGAQRAVGEERQAAGPELGVQVGDASLVVRQGRGEGIGRPVDARRRIEQAPGGGGVVHRGAHRHDRAVADVDRLAVHHPVAAVEGELEAVGVPLDHGPAADDAGVRAGVHHLLEVARVVDVVVGQVHPSHVLGLDQGEHVLEPLRPVRDRAGVEDHRLRAEDHHGVQVDEQRLAQRLLDRVDHVGVGGDLGGLDADRRAERSERGHWDLLRRARAGRDLSVALDHLARTRGVSSVLARTAGGRGQP